MKKVLVMDARMIGPVGHGISKYVEGIADNLANGDPLTDTLLQIIGAKNVDDLEIIFLIRTACPENSPVRKFKTIILDVSCYHPQSWARVPKILKTLQANLFFNPTFASYPYLPCPYVQTVHDLNHLWFGNLAQKIYYQSLLKHSIRNADLIFAVSETIKNELMGWTNLTGARIKVFYNRFALPLVVSSSRAETVLNTYRLKPKAYFLCVASDKPHKNTEMLISAHHAYFHSEIPKNKIESEWANAFSENTKLMGETQTKIPLAITLHKNNLTDSEGVFKIGGVDDETLAVLMQNCAGFYFPSLYEGFGRPPVEVAMNGVSFIAVSDIPVHREAEKISPIPFRRIQVK